MMKNKKLHNGFIEICEMNPDDVAGRVRIKMTSHLIHDNRDEWNRNGITWLEEYTESNKESAIGMNYVVDFIDDEKTIPSGHGEMSYDEDGNVQFEGEVVGSVVDAYITEIEIDGEIKKVFMTEGYINSQRYGNFVKWLREEIKNNTIHGSIEINGKGKNKQIEYLDGSHNEDGTLKVGRIPTVFDFSGLAILLETPADQYSQIVELNSNKSRSDEVKNNIEINEIDVDDIAHMVMKKFSELMRNKGVEYYYDYYIHKFYPESKTIIVRNWEDRMSYMLINYNIENSEITITEPIKVEEDWKPVGNEQSIEVNDLLINKQINSKGGILMEQIIREKDARIEELNSKVADLEKATETKDETITELNTTIVEVNKALESLKEEKETMTTELNSLREFKDGEEEKQKKAEVNSYFETEILANGFTEAEVNSLKEYVEKVDLAGLKSAEAELCVKKLKEMNKKEVNTEVNTLEDTFFVSTKAPKDSEVKVTELEEAARLFQ